MEEKVLAKSKHYNIIWGILLVLLIVIVFRVIVTINTYAEVYDEGNEKFKGLLDMGAITQEEFDAKKKQLLGL